MADLNLYRDNPEMDNNVINLDNTFSCTLKQQELSDSEDTNTCQTRLVTRKIIRNTAVNTNTGRISFLNIQDTNRISNLKTVAFVPEHTPLVTSQLHSDLDWERACSIGFYDKDTSICSLTLPSETLAELKGRVTSKELSYNNFATIIHDKKPYSIICYSSQHNDWKSKLFKFMETVNDCIKFPILFTISINELWHPIMPNKASTEEILQVVLQFNSNAYLHRYRFYTSDKKIKKTIDSILDTCFKHQLSLSRIASENDPTIYSTWRRRGANFNNDKLPATTNTTAKDQTLEITESQAFIKAAMEEQKNAWRQAEGVLLKSFAEFYKANSLNKGPLSLSIQALETKTAASKIAYDVIDLSTGQPLLHLNPTKQYCYGFDGTRFIKLTYNNSKYTVDSNTKPANKIILVSGETEVMNQLVLYGGIKNVDIDKITDIKLQLVQGVPGCGKTTTATQNWAILHAQEDINDLYETFHTITQSILNETCPLKTCTTRHNKGLRQCWDTECAKLKSEYIKALEKEQCTGRAEDKMETAARKKSYDTKLKSLRKEHMAEYISKADNRSRALWQVVNNQRKAKTDNNTELLLLMDNTIITQPAEVANCFNTFFSTVAHRTLQNSDLNPNPDPDDYELPPPIKQNLRYPPEVFSHNTFAFVFISVS
ncbi:hypothetical protein J6590_060139 [Homalodisca vitripennis]|nr:hypothetical protein J6590_060139 [Homalodisca vitripennis]